jgi:hypothetical protein
MSLLPRYFGYTKRRISRTQAAQHKPKLTHSPAGVHDTTQKHNHQPTKRPNEGGERSGERRLPLLGLTIPAYETHCWKW